MDFDGMDDMDSFGKDYGARPELEVLNKVVYANLSDGSRGSLGKIYFQDFVRKKRDTYLASLNIANIALRGRPGQGHHELMATTHSGVNIRISRNNSSDTFQIAANSALPADMQHFSDTAPGAVMTGNDLHNIFDDVHRKWARYEHADCQVFAAEIIKKVDLFGRQDVSEDSDDGFM
jgi:hypothetical protein